MAREINLVPDIKNEMLKAMKIRNYTLFACIVIAIASVVVSLVFWSIAAGQQAVADGKKKTLDTLSAKINSYSDLSEFITIRDQLGNLATISDSRMLLSRTFNILSAIIPRGADSISLSELTINLEEGTPLIKIEGQADARTAPFIDYNVLDSFKKSMKFMRYDYGEYVDKNGETIPSYCMIENAADGSTLYDSSKKDGSKYARGYYAYWLIDGDGCRPSLEEKEDENENEEDEEDVANTRIGSTTIVTIPQSNALSETEIKSYIGSYSSIEEYQGQRVVKVWRTPQYDDWYTSGDAESVSENDSNPHLTLDGAISNVPHFKSACTTYVGTESTKLGEKPTWKSVNDECKLVPNGDEGIVITDSRNGKDDESESLVLAFAAEITFETNFFAYKNKHMMAVAPTERVNVTDSYVQIQSLFAKRASDCSSDDVECQTNNAGGEQ